MIAIFYFCSHLSQMCTSVDPRLLSKAVYDFPLKYSIKDYTSIKNFFHSLVKADDVMKSVSMEGKVVIVTGANSGLGECDRYWWNIFRTLFVGTQFNIDILKHP